MGGKVNPISNIRDRSGISLASSDSTQANTESLINTRSSIISSEYVPYYVGGSVSAAAFIFAAVAWVQASAGTLVLAASTLVMVQAIAVVAVLAAIGLFAAATYIRSKEAKNVKNAEDIKQTEIETQKTIHTDHSQFNAREFTTDLFHVKVKEYIDDKVAEIEQAYGEGPANAFRLRINVEVQNNEEKLYTAYKNTKDITASMDSSGMRKAIHKIMNSFIEKQNKALDVPPRAPIAQNRRGSGEIKLEPA